MASLACPVLVLHTGQVSLVPCWNGQKLALWAGAHLYQLVLFDQGDHNDIQWTNETEYRTTLKAFVAHALASAG